MLPRFIQIYYHDQLQLFLLMNESCPQVEGAPSCEAGFNIEAAFGELRGSFTELKAWTKASFEELRSELTSRADHVVKEELGEEPIKGTFPSNSQPGGVVDVTGAEPVSLPGFNFDLYMENAIDDTQPHGLRVFNFAGKSRIPKCHLSHLAIKRCGKYEVLNQCLESLERTPRYHKLKKLHEGQLKKFNAAKEKYLAEQGIGGEGVDLADEDLPREIQRYTILLYSYVRYAAVLF
jgi:hypothetical protein